MSTNLQVVLLILVALALPVALLRWARTPEASIENAPRGDTARLLGLMLLGQFGVLLRARFALNSPGFWVCTVALLPIVAGAVWLTRRLFLSYRAPSRTPKP